MRLNEPPPWELIASALISISALVLVQLSPPSVRGLSTIPGLVFAIILFGYLLVLSLFPRHSDLSPRTRGLLSLGASTFLIAITGFVIIQGVVEITNAATILSLLTLIATAVAYVCWSALPRRRRFILLSKNRRGRRPRSTSSSSLLVGAGGSIVSLLSLVDSMRKAFLSHGLSTLTAAFANIRLPALSNRNRLAARSNRGDRRLGSLAGLPLPRNKGRFVFLLFILVIICALAVPMFNNNSHQIPSSETVKKVETPSSNLEDHLWTNSYNVKINELNNSSSINALTKNAQVTGEQSSQAVVVTEVSNESSIGNSTPSEEKPSPLESSEKVAFQGGSGGKSNPQKNSEPLSNETDIIPSSESPKENQTANPESLQEDKSKDEMELSNSPPAESSKDKVPYPESDNNTAVDSYRTEKVENQTNISNENETEASGDNQTYNSPPSLADLGPNRPSPQIDGTIIWTANASDPDGDTILYRFLLEDIAMTNWSTSNSWTWDTSTIAPGDYRIEVLIRDSKHASEDSFDDSKEITFSLIQPDQLPVLSDLRPDTISPQASGRSIVWKANATDPDGDVILYRFLLDDKVMMNWSTSNSWTWNTSALAPGDYRIKTLIKDGKHASDDTFDGFREVKFTLIQSNQQPVLGDLRPDIVSPQASGRSIAWTANATDPDGDLVLYKFLINDQPVTVWSRFNNFNWVTTKLSPGDYRIKVLVRDGKHAAEDSFDGSKEMTFSLTQPDQLPVIGGLIPDMVSPQASGKIIVWTANATDPDGDVILYRFILDDEVTANWSTANSWTWNTSALAPGDYRVKALIRDGKHASEDSSDNSKEVRFTLTQPNQPPVLEDLRPDMDSTQASAKSIVWTANATDPDGDLVLYKFLVNDQPATVWSRFNNFNWVTTKMAPGDYRIKVLIRDGKHAPEEGFDGSKEMKFTLNQPDQPPVIGDLIPDMVSPQASGQSIIWTADATDPDGDMILYRFMLDDKAMTSWSASSSWTWNTSVIVPGDYRIKVLIRDGKHAAEDAFDGSKEVKFTVIQPNQPPVIEDLRPDMDSPQVSGKGIAWIASAKDGDGDRVFYKFLMNDKAMMDWSTANSWTWNTSAIAPGDYRIKVLIRDGKHAAEDSFDGSREATFTLVHPDQRPVLLDLRPDMDSPQASGQSIAWKANATDPDGDMIFYSFKLNDKAMTTWSASSSWTWNTSAIAPGDYRIKVLIRDGKHASEDASDDSEEMRFNLTRPNQRPVLKDLRPDIDSPQAPGKNIVWTANAVDPDGDLVLYKFLINDQPATVWSRFDNFNWVTTKMAPGDYRIKVLIRDGKHASEDSFDDALEEKFTLSQHNQPPALGDFRPDTDSPQVSGKSIIWTANATDPDGDVILYRFMLNDKVTMTWSAANSWTWNTSTLAPGDYRIKVLIRDGKHAAGDSFDDSKEVKFNLTQPDQPPVLKDLRPDTDSPQASGKSIAWTASAADTDEDMLFYKFLMNDKAMKGWSVSNSWTWNTSTLAPGDYRIKVLIRDGKHASVDSFDDSREITFTLTKPNQRPVLLVLRPDMDSPQASGKSIVWTANAADPDGDMLFYKFLLNDKVMTDWSPSNLWTWYTYSVAPGDYRIKVLIRDGKHTSEDSFDGSNETTFTLLTPNRSTAQKLSQQVTNSAQTSKKASPQSQMLPAIM